MKTLLKISILSTLLVGAAACGRSENAGSAGTPTTDSTTVLTTTEEAASSSSSAAAGTSSSDMTMGELMDSFTSGIESVNNSLVRKVQPGVGGIATFTIDDYFKMVFKKAQVVDRGAGQKMLVLTITYTNLNKVPYSLVQMLSSINFFQDVNGEKSYIWQVADETDPTLTSYDKALFADSFTELKQGEKTTAIAGLPLEKNGVPVTITDLLDESIVIAEIETN